VIDFTNYYIIIGISKQDISMQKYNKCSAFFLYFEVIIIFKSIFFISNTKKSYFESVTIGNHKLLYRIIFSKYKCKLYTL